MVLADASGPGDFASVVPVLMAEFDSRYLSLALIGPATCRLQWTRMVSPAQTQTLGVRVMHPVSSRTDQTLPYPAQIIIPTPQLWVVSAPVAGMVTSLWGSRGDRVTSGQGLVTLQSPSFVSLQRTTCMPSLRRACHPAASTEHRTL